MKPGNVAFAIVAALAWATTLVFASGFDALLMCHLLLLSVGFIFLHHTSVQHEVMLNQVAFLALLGPVGAIAGLVLVAGAVFRKRPDEDALTEWFEELSGRTARSTENDIVREIDAGRLRPQFVPKLQSAHELILSGTLNEKRDVLTWIVRKRDPALYSLLEVAVQGSDPIIRSQAASILFRLRNQSSQAPP